MPPGTIAGRYRVEREVGRGGMGSVWLCRDELLGRQVAVKQVGHLPGESTPDLARALREARSSAPLNHRNVVSVYDAIEEGDHLWLVMEYVPGRTLSEVMAAEGPLPPKRVAWIGAQIADGLAAAHARGTMHRDVKPGNILVADDDRALISDFGIARTHGDAQLTQAGFVTGTPAYFSPALARGEDPTMDDDVWALGASLFAAVEGRAPFPEQRNALAMLATIATADPPEPDRAGFLSHALGRMLDPDPATRWSMAEAAQSLHRLRDKHDTTATRESAAVVAEPSAPTLEQPVPAAPLAGAAPVPVATRPADRPRRRVLPAVLSLVAVLLVAGVAWLVLRGGADQGRDTAAPPTGDRTPSRTPSRSPDRSPSGTASDPSSPATTTETSAPPAPPASGGSRSAFVESYYGVLPDDTESGWAMLSESYHANTTYDHYRGFWNTIDAVSVDDTAPAPGGAVDVTLTYTSGDGGTEQEVRRIELERSDGGYLITGDQAVG